MLVVPRGRGNRGLAVRKLKLHILTRGVVASGHWSKGEWGSHQSDKIATETTNQERMYQYRCQSWKNVLMSVYWGQNKNWKLPSWDSVIKLEKSITPPLKPLPTSHSGMFVEDVKLTLERIIKVERRRSCC